MSYINADELLPPHLVKEIQKYIQGGQIYIPKNDGKRLGWGKKNGTRDELNHRNAEIRLLKQSGLTIQELAERYRLSTDSIRKILYGSGRKRSANSVADTGGLTT